jgi:spermidine/putrescine transport system ATP-binding protein
LRIIGGFEEPSSGEVIIGGRDAVGTPPYNRNTNMVFQHLALFPHLSVAQNIAFGLEMKKFDRATIERKIKDTLALVRLSGYEDRGISMLSGGQKQRVAIARAIVNEPEVLLLDEPLGALDLQLRLQMHEELRRIHKETHSTWIFVTHDQGEAITLSDRIAVMSQGRIVQLGTPRDIYERPATRFAAEFVGHANLLEAVVQATDESGLCTVDAGGWLLQGLSSTALKPGQTVVAVLRHEKARILATGSGIAGHPGTVIDSTYLGPSIRSVVQLDQGVRLTIDTPISALQQECSAGSSVQVSWAAHDLLIVPY